jgi:hypothetical protein
MKTFRRGQSARLDRLESLIDKLTGMSQKLPVIYSRKERSNAN